MWVAPNTNVSQSSVRTASMRPTLLRCANSASASPGACTMVVNLTAAIGLRKVTYHNPVKPECHNQLLHLWCKPVWFSKDLLAVFDGWASRTIENENRGNSCLEEARQTVEDGVKLWILTRLCMGNNKDVLALSKPQTTDDCQVWIRDNRECTWHQCPSQCYGIYFGCFRTPQSRSAQ